MKYKIILISLLFLSIIPLIAQNMNINDKLSYGTDRWRPLFSDPVQSIVTNQTSEITVTNFLIPANSMGSNGVLRITLLGAAQTVNGDNKFYVFRLNGTLIRRSSLSSGTQQSIMFQESLINRNDPKQQIGFPATAVAGYSGFNSSPNALSTFAIDTTITNMFTVGISNQVSADSISLEFLHLEVLRTQ